MKIASTLLPPCPRSLDTNIRWKVNCFYCVSELRAQITDCSKIKDNLQFGRSLESFSMMCLLLCVCVRARAYLCKCRDDETEIRSSMLVQAHHWWEPIRWTSLKPPFFLSFLWWCSAVSSCPPHPHLAHLSSRELLHSTDLFTCPLRSGPSEETRTSAVLPHWLLKRLLNSQWVK